MTFILRIIHGESAFVVFKDLVATLTPNSPLKAKNHQPHKDEERRTAYGDNQYHPR